MDEELMRKFLIKLAQNHGGGRIVLHDGSLRAIDPNSRIKFHREGECMVMSVETVKDEWGRVLDRCGQVRCSKSPCFTYVNYCYPDGSKRERCSDHD